PISCLNPTMTVGQQIVEGLHAHQGISRAAAWERAVELLADVGIPAPRRRINDYPHHLSGGLAQRVMIAMALSCDPQLLIADEPTTALDVTIEAQIIDLLAGICEQRGTAVVLITHDLGVLARFADRILVMYAGRIIEQGPVDKMYYKAEHPYTWGLMTSVTRIDEPRRTRLSTIGGAPPSAVRPVPGCAFHPRCPWAAEVCRSEVPELRVHGGFHGCACHFAGELPPPQDLRKASS
ncbi:MAG TPA: ABC transporter ATP-binding protein, partial [Thermomicrobiales bacterium]|nr:ABC transporter ATP-binding protein [Thermomicrobiales bacterium]